MLLRFFLVFFSPFFFFGNNFSFLLCHFLESVNSATIVNQLLLAGIKRMANRTNFNLDFFRCRSSRKAITAGAGNLGFGVIFWMDIFFHSFDFFLKCKNSLANLQFFGKPCAFGWGIRLGCVPDYLKLVGHHGR